MRREQILPAITTVSVRLRAIDQALPGAIYVTLKNA